MAIWPPARSASAAAGPPRKNDWARFATVWSEFSPNVAPRAPGGWSRVMAAVKQTVEHVESLETYKHGFVSDIEQDFAPKGLNADIVRFISAKKDEPEWMLDWRLDAFERWLAMDEPKWAKVHFPRIDYQDSYYYAAPKQKVGPKSLDEVDPEHPGRLQEAGHPAEASRRSWPASRARRAMPWTPCSTASAWSRPSRRSWRRSASSSAR
jgi:hypothetical protein